MKATDLLISLGSRVRVLAACLIGTAIMTICFHAAAKEETSIPTIIGSDLIKDQSLQAALKSYYHAEANRDWEHTYEMRRKQFQETVPLERYLVSMEKSQAGVALSSVEVLNVAEQHEVVFGKSVVITILFADVITDRSQLWLTCDPQHCRDGDERFWKEDTIWIRQDNAWKCLECGTRGQSSLNGRMVYDQ